MARQRLGCTEWVDVLLAWAFLAMTTASMGLELAVPQNMATLSAAVNCTFNLGLAAAYIGLFSALLCARGQVDPKNAEKAVNALFSGGYAVFALYFFDVSTGGDPGTEIGSSAKSLYIVGSALFTVGSFLLTMSSCIVPGAAAESRSGAVSCLCGGVCFLLGSVAFLVDAGLGFASESGTMAPFVEAYMMRQSMRQALVIFAYGAFVFGRVFFVVGAHAAVSKAGKPLAPASDIERGEIYC